MTGQPLQFDKRFSGMKPHAPVDPHHKELVKQTQKWVSQTFFGALLKQMRNSPFKSDLLDGGRGGQAFNEMFDQQLADRMARGSGSKLVNAIVRKTEAAAAYRKHTNTKDQKKSAARTTTTANSTTRGTK
jgi:Rod binding domain-containing protein